MPDIASYVAKCNAWVAEVQAIPVVVPPPPPPTVIAIDVSVVTITKNPCPVRQLAQSNAPWQPQPIGTTGVVRAPGFSNGYWWVVFPSGPSGYVFATNLAIAP